MPDYEIWPIKINGRKTQQKLATRRQEEVTGPWPSGMVNFTVSVQWGQNQFPAMNYGNTEIHLTGSRLGNTINTMHLE